MPERPEKQVYSQQDWINAFNQAVRICSDPNTNKSQRAMAAADLLSISYKLHPKTGSRKKKRQ